jgi:AraC-like DNA-binding protein
LPILQIGTKKHLGTSMSLLDVALSVGFQTQSHFTSMFMRMVGQPPRGMEDAAALCDFGTERAGPEGFGPSRLYLTNSCNAADQQ